MTDLYNESELEVVKKQKKTILTIYFSTLFVYLVVCISLLVYYTQQDYNTPKRTPLLWSVSILTVLFVVFSFIFLGIKYKRSASYYAFLKNVLTIQSVDGVHVFVRHDKRVVVKDKVDFTSLIFMEWSEKEHEFYDLAIYVDNEKQIPEFNKGDKIYHKTYANVLTGFEVRNDNIFE